MAVCQHGYITSACSSEGVCMSGQGAHVTPCPHLNLRDTSSARVSRGGQDNKGCPTSEGHSGEVISAATHRMPAKPHLISLFSHRVPDSLRSCHKAHGVSGSTLRSSLSCAGPLEVMWGAIRGSERASNVVNVTQHVSGEWQRWNPQPVLSVS